MSFVFPRVSMFPSTSSRETLRLSGKQNSLFPSGAHIKCIITMNNLWSQKYSQVSSDALYNVKLSIITSLGSVRSVSEVHLIAGSTSFQSTKLLWKFKPGTAEKRIISYRSSGKNQSYAFAMRVQCLQLEIIQDRVTKSIWNLESAHVEF